MERFEFLRLGDIRNRYGIALYHFREFLRICRCLSVLLHGAPSMVSVPCFSRCGYRAAFGRPAAMPSGVSLRILGPPGNVHPACSLRMNKNDSVWRRNDMGKEKGRSRFPVMTTFHAAPVISGMRRLIRRNYRFRSSDSFFTNAATSSSVRYAEGAACTPRFHWTRLTR